MTVTSALCPRCNVRRGLGSCSECAMADLEGVEDQTQWISGVLEYLEAPRDELRRHLQAWANGKPWGRGPPQVGFHQERVVNRRRALLEAVILDKQPLVCPDCGGRLWWRWRSAGDAVKTSCDGCGIDQDIPMRKVNP
jgi:hypothetical protein